MRFTRPTFSAYQSDIGTKYLEFIFSAILFDTLLKEICFPLFTPIDIVQQNNLCCQRFKCFSLGMSFVSIFGRTRPACSTVDTRFEVHEFNNKF